MTEHNQLHRIQHFITFKYACKTNASNGDMIGQYNDKKTDEHNPLHQIQYF